MPSSSISGRGARSLAERFRAARERFELACQMGCTPIEAQAEIDRRHARTRWEDSARRLAQRRAARTTTPESIATEAASKRAPWWLND